MKTATRTKTWLLNMHRAIPDVHAKAPLVVDAALMPGHSPATAGMPRHPSLPITSSLQAGVPANETRAARGIEVYVLTAGERRSQKSGISPLS